MYACMCNIYACVCVCMRACICVCAYWCMSNNIQKDREEVKRGRGENEQERIHHLFINQIHIN